jgi:hypothetical protein
MTLVRRIFGFLLIIAAILGLIISIVGIYYVWHIEPAMVSGMQNTVNLLSATLETTSQGLVVTKDALRNSVDMIGNMEMTLQTTAKAIDSANPMFDEITTLMDKQLPTTIQATQKSLNTAQESAQVIDSVLGTLSSIPLLGASIGYNPDVPLAQALGDVSQSLNGLPESFAGMKTSLQNTQNNIQTFQADLSMVTASVSQIQDSVSQYEMVVDNYHTSLQQVQAQLDLFSQNVPTYVHTFVIALTFFLVWMILAQIGLFTQGYEMFTLENI